MKLTQSYLKQIIKEELQKMREQESNLEIPVTTSGNLFIAGLERYLPNMKPDDQEKVKAFLDSPVYKMLKDYGVSGFSKGLKSFKARVSLDKTSFIKEEVIVTQSGEGIMVQTAKLNVKGQEDPSVPRKDITSKLNSSVLEDLKAISNALRTATTFTLN